MTNDERTRRALEIVAERRQRAVTLAQQRAAEVRAAVPALADAERERTMAGLAAAQLAAGGAERAQIDAALARADTCEKKIASLLRENGYTPDAMQPAYTCTLCRDTGRTEQGLCSCVQAVVRELRQQEINAASPLSLCTFDSFRLDKYPDTILPELGISAREHMAGILHYCRSYAENFTLRNPSLYLFGYAGLGKTHLALAIARAVLEKGYNVVYVSAQNAFEAMEKEHFGASGDTMATLQGAQLLILDDLGTEFISPYVSSCLYSLINTRVCRRLPTIYTSNIIRDADLQRRYTEKVVSRLLGSCEMLSFCGEDIRLQGK